MRLSGKILRNSAFCGVLAATVLQASAITYRDIDAFGTPGQGQYVGGNNTVNGTFSILNPSEGNSVTISSGYGSESGKTYSDISGFMPGYDLAYDASAYFYVRDDGDKAKEVVSIKMEGLQFDKQYSYSATTIADGNSWLVNAILLVLLNLDGTLQYSVKALDGSDFYLEFARLDVQAKNIFPHPSPGGTPGTSVPDGGATALLLGSALIGIFMVRREK
jgi:VPDSG-CTERM motif